MSAGTSTRKRNPTINAGQVVYVKASYFDEGIKYSDNFKHKEESLLRGTVINISGVSAGIKFDIDGRISSIKHIDIITIITKNQEYLVVDTATDGIVGANTDVNADCLETDFPEVKDHNQPSSSRIDDKVQFRIDPAGETPVEKQLHSIEKIVDTETLHKYKRAIVEENETEIKDDDTFCEWKQIKRLKELDVQTLDIPASKSKHKKGLKGVNKRLRWKKELHQGMAVYKTKKGKQRVPKVMKFIPCKCKNKCIDNFPREERQIVFIGYWAIESDSQRRQFLCNSVTFKTPKQRTTAGDSRREITKLYTINVLNNTINVCRIVFLNMFDISEIVLWNACKTLPDTNISKPDMQGRGVVPIN